jgi:hypothetical protein
MFIAAEELPDLLPAAAARELTPQDAPDAAMSGKICLLVQIHCIALPSGARKPAKTPQFSLVT